MTTLKVRRPEVPGERSVRHILAVSELCVGLIEQARQARAEGVQVVAFAAEPASWWPNGQGGFLKPDAYASLALGTVRDHWWIEVDLATESLPTVKRKLLAYIDFVARGQLGPGHLVPRVLICANTRSRHIALRSVISKLPPPAEELFVTHIDHEAAAYLLRSLQA